MLTKRTIFTIVSACLFLNNAIAQEIPSEIKPIFPKKGAKTKDHLSFQKLTVAQKDFLTEGTTKNPNGYLSVVVPISYLEQMRKLDMTSGFDVSTKNKLASFEGMALVGERQEGPHRKAYFFGDRAGAEVMVTIWHYKAAGAAMVGFDEFVNQKVDEMDGTLSLATNPESSQCLWKLTVSDNETLFEVVLSDQIIEQKPSMPVAKVMNKMRKLIDFARSSGQ